MSVDIKDEETGQVGGVLGLKGAHNVLERTSTAASGTTRVGIYLAGTWRLKGVAIKNPDSAVLETSRIMIQFNNLEIFDAAQRWFPMSTAECDQDLEHYYDPEDKILQYATVYAEVTHLSAIAHTVSIIADKIGEGPQGAQGSMKPINIQAPRGLLR